METRTFFLAGILLLATVAAAQQRPFDLPAAAPESLGIDPGILREHADELFRRSTQAYIIVFKDKIVCERYAPDWDRHKPHYTASAAKGLMGGLALMLAMHDGLIAPDDLACQYIPQWKDDPQKSTITIRMLGAHTSGLEDSTEKGVPNQSLPGWKGDFWRQQRNPFLIARDETPVLFTPGAGFQYSNPGIGMLNYAVTAALRGTAHQDIRTYLWERLIQKMGIPREEWSVGYGKTFEQDGLPLVATWGGGMVSPRGMAAVGRLLANKGTWDGEQLIRAEVVDNALKPPGGPSTCASGFWLNRAIDGNTPWPSLPQDAAMAAGAQDQIMLFSPARNLIVVRFGDGTLVSGNNVEQVLDTTIGAPLAKAFAF